MVLLLYGERLGRGKQRGSSILVSRAAPVQTAWSSDEDGQGRHSSGNKELYQIPGSRFPYLGIGRSYDDGLVDPELVALARTLGLDPGADEANGSANGETNRLGTRYQSAIRDTKQVGWRVSTAEKEAVEGGKNNHDF